MCREGSKPGFYSLQDEHERNCQSGSQSKGRAGRFASIASGTELLQLQFRSVGTNGRVAGSIPAILIEALGAYVWHGSAGSVERPGQDCTSNTGGPLRVQSAVAHGSNVVTVLNDEVALGVIVRKIVRAHVTLVNVRGIGKVHNQRGL